MSKKISKQQFNDFVYNWSKAKEASKFEKDFARQFNYLDADLKVHIGETVSDTMQKFYELFVEKANNGEVNA